MKQADCGWQMILKKIYDKLNANEVDLDEIPHLLTIIKQLKECAEAGYFGDDI